MDKAVQEKPQAKGVERDGAGGGWRKEWGNTQTVLCLESSLDQSLGRTRAPREIVTHARLTPTMEKRKGSQGALTPGRASVSTCWSRGARVTGESVAAQPGSGGRSGDS